MGRKRSSCDDCRLSKSKRRCTHLKPLEALAQPSPAAPLEPRTSREPERFAEDERYGATILDRRHSAHVAIRRPSSQPILHSTSATSTAAPISRTSTVTFGPMDAWLHTKKVDVQITRAAKILASVAAEVSDAITTQIREVTEANAQLDSQLRRAQREASLLKHKLACA